MLWRETHPQGARPADEAKRRIHDERLAVDAHRHRVRRCDLERRRRPCCQRRRNPWATVLQHRHSEFAAVDPRARARADGPPEPVGVVGHQDHRRRLVRGAVLTAPGELARRAARLRTEHVGRGVEDRAQLRVPVSLALHRLGVEPERRVVDEHPPVDLGQIDAALPTVDERIEGADDIVAVDPQVEREVVAGTGRDAGERQVVLGRDRRHERLGAVAASRGEPVGATGHGVTDQLFQVVAGLQLDRLDPTCPRLVGQVVADGLAAPDFGFQTTIASSRRAAAPERRRERRTRAWPAQRSRGGARRRQDRRRTGPPVSTTTTAATSKQQYADEQEHAGRDPAAEPPATPRHAPRSQQARPPPEPRGKSRTTSTTATTTAATNSTKATPAATRRPNIQSSPLPWPRFLEPLTQHPRGCAAPKGTQSTIKHRGGDA